jgi:uncharacterized protein (DUF58 family)
VLALLERLGSFRSRVGPPRVLKLTRDGWFYLAFTLGVGAAAINTGNNLLYLVLGLQLTSIIISGVLSESAITGLRLESVGAADARAGEEGRWLLRLHKASGRIPSFTLTLSAADGPAQGTSAGILRVAPDQPELVELRFVAPRRGRFLAQRVRISTRFPFGLFEKSRELEVRQELFVYPRAVAGTAVPPAPLRRDGQTSTRRAGRGPELHALRGWVPGDGLARMHWKKSAQQGSLVVAVREAEQADTVELRLDLHALPDPTDLLRLEGDLERAAAGAVAALDRGLSVCLLLGRTRVEVPADEAGRRRLLRALACAEPELAG